MKISIVAVLVMLISLTLACETVCFYASGNGYGYCDYYCKKDSGGHNGASTYAYAFAKGLRAKGYRCSVVGSAESDVHCDSMTKCTTHTWKAGSDC
ncbi:hypothetical protein DM01DRAFT_1336960 [Hesseltinella vesiculosa]|uniref:Uncharacterized protein n=1 Tax=Hesseltinella vesiculosa TaxID=101127 RepID=A0A1X2GEM3_9FUNG|nr:hypothetical protein DM01DRAFT_1336960 [Hesseltinella vesiculosa]